MKNSGWLIDHAAAWIPAADGEARVPRELRVWLAEPGLLSDRVAAASAGTARFRLLGEGATELDAGARRRLGVSDAAAHERLGEFHQGGARVIATQSLFPRSTLARHPWLIEIGGALLGERLKRVASVTRDPFEYLELPLDHPLSHARAGGARDDAPRHTWARRAVHRIDGAPILVTEVFSPDVTRWMARPVDAESCG